MAAKLRILVLALLALQACVEVDIVAGDPRLGENGHVRFVGGGCAAGSSTAIAVGSTQKLTLEAPEGQTLPADLAPGSTAPTVIDARPGASTTEVLLEARAAGDAVVELLSAGALYDHLAFEAVPAASVRFAAPSAVFAGGTAYVKVDEVHGSCDGSDCALLGESFLRWSGEPAAGLTPLRDAGGTAYFTAGAPGDVRVQGREPSGGALLVDHPLHVVPTADAGTLAGMVTVMLPDGETILDPQPAPAEIPAGSLFVIQVQADAGGTTVPVAGADVVWTVEGDIAAVAPQGDALAEGPIYTAVEAGTVDLVATIAVLGRTERYALTITAAP
jgi:hypothetical protein